MNVTKVKQELSAAYPGSAIFENDIDGVVTEILCEVDPTTNHPEYSLAVAVIDSSAAHVHKVTVETYKVIKGSLKLHIDEQVVELSEGDSYVVKPGQPHWAEGTETWVEVYSEPGWTLEDHHLL